jgi:hypothetical protein
MAARIHAGRGLFSGGKREWSLENSPVVSRSIVLRQHGFQPPEPDVLRIPPQIAIQERDALGLAALFLIKKHQVDPGRLERGVEIDGDRGTGAQQKAALIHDPIWAL